MLPSQSFPKALFYRLWDIVTFTPAGVYRVLKVLQINKVNGADSVINRILRDTADVMVDTLSKLLNTLMESSHLPLLWKRPNISPIHKKRWQATEELQPYISSTLLRQSIGACNFDEYCSTNNLLTSNNSGFKKHDLTVNWLLGLTAKLYHPLGDGSDVFDVTKTFEKVSQGLAL